MRIWQVFGRGSACGEESEQADKMNLKKKLNADSSMSSYTAVLFSTAMLTYLILKTYGGNRCREAIPSLYHYIITPDTRVITLCYTTLIALFLFNTMY